ncbi:MAG TPA: GNAT family N-acetyltransferase [Ignavibacteria bacterium]
MKTFKLNNKEFVIRQFDRETDSIKELTELLHSSYKRLADMGLRFVATHQDEKYTKDYMKKGECYILTSENRILGTIFYYTKMWEDAPEIYKRDDVVLFGKFAVEPEYQNLGLGSMLMDFIENYARSNGMKEIVLDTSEKAYHLIEYYNKRGYEYIHYWQWPDVNYKSVVMSKKL